MDIRLKQRLVVEALENYLAVRGELHGAGGETALFLSDRGTRWGVRAIEEMVKKYAVRAGIDRTITPHILRHACATVLVEEGATLPTIQEHLGHESVETTRRYIHVSNRARQHAVEALGARVEARLGELKGGEQAASPTVE